MKKAIYFLIILFTAIGSISAQVAINEDGSRPNNSAILDLKSKNKGLLLPRINDPANEISKPTSGLMVYNTAEKNLNYFNGNNWAGLAKSTDIKPESNFYSIFPNSKGFFASYNINNTDFAQYSLVVPAGVTKLWIEGWAGGQAGFKIEDRYIPTNRLPVGGGAGSFGSFVIAVIPNETIIIKVGKGGYLGEDNQTNLAGDTIIETIEGTYKIKKTSLFEFYLNEPELLSFNGLINYVQGEKGQNSKLSNSNGELIAGKGGDAYPNQKGGLGADESFIRYSSGGVTYIRSLLFASNAQNGQMPGGGGGAGVIPGFGGPGLVIIHW
jgi:hypothetical protein